MITVAAAEALFKSKALRALVAVVLLLGVAWGLKSCLEGRGYDKAKVEQAIEQGEANVKEHDRQVERDETSATITRETDKQAEKAVSKSEETTTKLKEKVRDVYGQKPTTAPVAVGVVLHPLDGRVQRAIDDAIDQANGTAR